MSVLTTWYRILISCGFLVLTAFPVSGDESMTTDRLIRLARSSIGPDRVLNEVQSLHYIGQIEDITEGGEGTIVLYFKRPLKQRIEIYLHGILEVTAVNGYEGFMHRVHKESGNDDFRVLGFLDVERMLVNSWETLNFFREPKERFGKSTYEGRCEYRGRDAYRMHTEYPGGSTFTRYFDVHTGELISTINDRGLEIVEFGMLRSSGLKFPRRMEAYRNGRKTYVIRFDEVYVNSKVPDALFEHPER